MVIWWIIGIFAVFVILGAIVMKMGDGAKRVKLFFLLSILLLLLLSFFWVFSGKKVDLNDPKGIMNAVGLYSGWAGHTIVNLWDVGKTTGKAVFNAVKPSS